MQPIIKPLIIGELNPPLSVTLHKDTNSLWKLQNFFNKSKEQNKGHLGWDIETTPLKDFYFRRARTVQFGDHSEQHVIDLLPFADNDPELLFSCQGRYGVDLPPKLRELAEFMKPVVCTNDFLKVGVNLGFEYQSFYWMFGLRTFNFYDCMMAEKCIWAGGHSLKDYAFYSMDGLMTRYFKLHIDKTFQTSFTLDEELSQGQIDYAALDTRFPLSIKAVQQIVADGKKLWQMGPNTRKYFEHLEPKVTGTGEPIILGDNLNEIIQIENDAIGFFEDMHIHGERLDKEKWKARIVEKKAELKTLISDVLDPIFMPLVGSKYDIATDDQIAAADALWKSYNLVSDAEVNLKKDRRAALKISDHEKIWEIDTELDRIETKRKSDKEIYKTAASDMKKQRTKIKNLAAKCEGEALINYGSDAQLMAVVQGIKGLKGVKSMDDEALEKYEDQGFSVMGAIRKLHGLAKEIGTYGDQWATEWSLKPCKEEGWLNPGDGRLHCVYNQYDAETGRSSSEKPNGQNLPQDEAIRSCFIADEPNEDIRISDCCDADTHWSGTDLNGTVHVCSSCNKACSTHAEEYVIITADMSGAELRIIAELADDPVWCGAFNRGEDVHSVGTEILHEENWTSKTAAGCKYYAPHTAETVARIPNVTIGEPQRQKCKCPAHAELRNDNKATNFLLAYGGGPGTLSKAIKKTLDKAKELMALHAEKFPRIWSYLDMSGKNARMMKRAFDMFGRRRLFPDPTYERAKERVKIDKEQMLRLPDEESNQKLSLFEEYHKRKPDADELYVLTHREPTGKEVSSMMGAMAGSIERQGKNHRIQGSNATIIKLAGGCGYDKDGKPYLWHVFPLYRAKVLKMVHDELVVHCPKHRAAEVAALIGDAFKRAASTKMSKVVMEFDFNIAKHWKK